MEFPKLKSFDTALGTLKLILIVVIICSAGLIGFISYYFTNELRKNNSSVWVVDQKSFEVFRANQKNGGSTLKERESEYKNHIIDFYTHFYSFDQFTYKDHVNYALNLIGNSGKQLLADYQKEDIHRKLAEMNMQVDISVDSIILDISSNPVRGMCFAKQTFITSEGRAARFMNSKFVLFDLAKRTDKNSHACLIEDFKIFNTGKVNIKDNE